MKWFTVVLLSVFAFQFCLINSQPNYDVTTYAYLTDRPYSSSCKCYPEGFYNCVNSTWIPLIATFMDPIPIVTGMVVTITTIRIEMTCSYFCTLPLTYSNYALQLNLVQLSPLIYSTEKSCACSCKHSSNITHFEFGLISYNRSGINTITITPRSYSDACFSGVNVSMNYEYSPSSPSPSSSHYVYPSVSPTQSPIPTHNAGSITPYSSPAPSSSGGSSYECCVYVSDSTSDYSITCTTTSTCPNNSGFTLISQYPTTDCAECFA